MLGAGETVTELTEQNIQARMRGAADVELVELLRRAVPADRQHEREGGRLHHHRRRPEGALAVHRQRAEDGGDGPARLPATRSTGYEGIALVLAKPAGPGAGAEPGGRGGADALPGARRLLPPLRRREAARRTRCEQALARDVPRAARATQLDGLRREVRRGSSCSRSTSGCSRRSRCTSATSTSTASARCSSRS